MSKAGRPKKGSAGLPEWFDIERYYPSESYRAMEWLWQLAYRYIFYEQLCREVVDPKIAAIWQDLIAATAHIDEEDVHDAFVLHGVATPANGDVHIIKAPGDDIIRRLMDLLEPISGVEVMTNRNMKDITSGDPIIPEKDTNEKTWGLMSFGGKGFFAHPSKRYMEIDFRLPDALLKERFAERLREQRKSIKTSIGAFFRSQDFAAWCNSGVLPYIDLMLWEKASGQTFRWSSFVDALSSVMNQPVGSEEACRKTAKALAAKLLTENTLFVLNYQTGKELGEGTKKSGKLLLR